MFKKKHTHTVTHHYTHITV